VTRTAIRLLILWSTCSTVPAVAGAQVLDFEKDVSAKGPSGFSVEQTGAGSAPRWIVEKDPTAPSGSHVLVQRSADDTSSRFPLAVYQETLFADGTVAVKFKTISGKVDQAAGIIWRYRDRDNYYLVRANALEGNVVLYKVERGKRFDLKPTDAGHFAYGKKAVVKTGSWHELRVGVKGDLFRVSLDGSHLFDVRDTTFVDRGKVGLWTKADSVTSFDDLSIASDAPGR
jgi:hypothetical protein